MQAVVTKYGIVSHAIISNTEETVCGLQNYMSPVRRVDWDSMSSEEQCLKCVNKLKTNTITGTNRGQYVRRN